MCIVYNYGHGSVRRIERLSKYFTIWQVLAVQPWPVGRGCNSDMIVVWKRDYLFTVFINSIEVSPFRISCKNAKSAPQIIYGKEWCNIMPESFFNAFRNNPCGCMHILYKTRIITWHNYALHCTYLHIRINSSLIRLLTSAINRSLLLLAALRLWRLKDITIKPVPLHGCVTTLRMATKEAAALHTAGFCIAERWWWWWRRTSDLIQPGRSSSQWVAKSALVTK